MLDSFSKLDPITTDSKIIFIILIIIQIIIFYNINYNTFNINNNIIKLILLKFL
jgi:hypothetical protein